MQGQVAEDQLHHKQADLHKQYRYHLLNESQVVKQSQSWQQEQDHGHNEHAEVEFLYAKVVAVDTVAHHIKFFAVKKVDECAKHR